MQPIFPTAAIREIEQGWVAAHPGESLMERAGLAAAEHARHLAGDGYRVLVVCGPGNNGGDGLVAARHLRTWGYRVTVRLAGDPARFPPDAAAAWAAFRAAGGVAENFEPPWSGFDLIIDALFGIGLARPVEGEAAALIEAINASGAPVLALDIPSGLASDTGVARGPVVRARETLTFVGLKPGLVTGQAAEFAGRVTVADLGVAAEAAVDAPGRLLDQAAVAGWLPRRAPASHKGSHGAVGIVGGAEGMLGAAMLAAHAALKAGAGLVFAGTLAKPAPGVDPLHPEIMWRSDDELLSMDRLSVLAIGPGLGRSGHARVLLGRFLELALPLVLDADALNLIAGQEPLQVALASRGWVPSVLTPHPAEAARLLGVTTAQVQADRVQAAVALAERFHAVAVLKGAGSIVAEPGGHWAVNPTGNPGMASGGMGDVLTGLIAALMAQGLAAPQAAQLAVYLHGAAADSLVARGIGPVGLTASEVTDEARRLVNQWVYAPGG